MKKPTRCEWAKLFSALQLQNRPSPPRWVGTKIETNTNRRRDSWKTFYFVFPSETTTFYFSSPRSRSANSLPQRFNFSRKVASRRLHTLSQEFQFSRTARR